MRIFALDLGRKCGFASGTPNSIPLSGIWQFSEGRAIAQMELRNRIHLHWDKNPPEIVVVEAPLPLKAFARLKTSENSVRMTYGMHAVAEIAALEYDIDFKEVSADTARKHFIGRANFGNRNDTKREVIRRCHQLGFMKTNENNDNQADAICCWDWGIAHLTRKSPRELHMFP